MHWNDLPSGSLKKKRRAAVFFYNPFVGKKSWIYTVRIRYLAQSPKMRKTSAIFFFIIIFLFLPRIQPTCSKIYTCGRNLGESTHYKFREKNFFNHFFIPVIRVCNYERIKMHNTYKSLQKRYLLNYIFKTVCKFSTLIYPFFILKFVVKNCSAYSVRWKFFHNTILIICNDVFVYSDFAKLWIFSEINQRVVRHGCFFFYAMKKLFCKFCKCLTKFSKLPEKLKIWQILQVLTIFAKIFQ